VGQDEASKSQPRFIHKHCRQGGLKTILASGQTGKSDGRSGWMNVLSWVKNHMQKFYSFFYYCFYSTVIRRDNDISHKRASDLLSFVSSFLILAIYLRCAVMFRFKIPSDGWISLIGLLVLFFGNMYLHGLLFSKNDKYLKTISQWDKLYNGPKIILNILSIALIVGSFIVLAISGIGYSLFINPR
jgi:hypothetical protein